MNPYNLLRRWLRGRYTRSVARRLDATRSAATRPSSDGIEIPMPRRPHNSEGA